MMKQTRNALIYSDLALFVLDTREGITYNDVALYNWLTRHSLRLQSDKEKLKEMNKIAQARSESGPTMDDFESVVDLPEVEIVRPEQS